MKIKTKSDITTILNNLTNDVMCAAIFCDHHFVCGVTPKEHKFKFNPYLSIGADESKVHHYFEMFGKDKDFDVIYLSSNIELVYIIKQEILQNYVLGRTPEDTARFLLVQQNLGKPVMVSGSTSPLILVGMSATLEDLYYIFYSPKSDNLVFYSAVTKLDILNDFNYNQKENFLERVTKLRHQHFHNPHVEEVEIIKF